MIDFGDGSSKIGRQNVSGMSSAVAVYSIFFRQFGVTFSRHLCQQRCMKDAKFAIEVRLIKILAFILEDIVKKAFETLIESAFYETYELELFLCPITSSIFGWGNKIGMSNGVVLWSSWKWKWNCFKNVSEGLPRTYEEWYNGVEGWHNTLYAFPHDAHPSMWKVINIFKQEENLTRVRKKRFIQRKEKVIQKKNYQLLIHGLSTFVRDSDFRIPTWNCF